VLRLEVRTLMNGPAAAVTVEGETGRELSGLLRGRDVRRLLRALASPVTAVRVTLFDPNGDVGGALEMLREDDEVFLAAADSTGRRWLFGPVPPRSVVATCRGLNAWLGAAATPRHHP
jgi:hypothetical protein